MNITIIIIIILVIIIIIMMMEEDRNFSDYEKKYAHNFNNYYFNQFPMPILGLYNTIIRAFHPSHGHNFDTVSFESAKILEDNYEIIKKEALEVYNKKNTLNMKDIGQTYFDDLDKEPNQWKVYVIKWYDKIHENALINCPETSKIIPVVKKSPETSP